MITILDGGMGQELVARAPEPPTELWSAEVMDRHPRLVVDVHRAYMDAGANIITVNAYSATRCRLGPRGRADDYERLQRLAIDLALEARGDAAVAIAGCLSPFAWSYRPELAPSFEEMLGPYAETASLQAPRVDLIICETMGSAREGAAAAVAASTTGRPVWVSWSLHDDASGRLRSGETIDAAVAELVRHGATPAAILVNCSTPEAISAAVPRLVDLGRQLDVEVGAYANGFGAVADDYGPQSTVETLGRRPDLNPAGYLTRVRQWVDAGCTIVGGCCEIGPDHIEAIATHLRRPVAPRDQPAHHPVRRPRR